MNILLVSNSDICRSRMAQKILSSYGYAQDSSSGNRGICEVYNGYTYASLNSHVAKISSDGSYEYLS
jgi:protein-tyrosine-phosphatase